MRGIVHLTDSSLIGGCLMFLVGVLYLLFEKSILVDSKSSRDELSSPAVDGVSRIILGTQVSYNCRNICVMLTQRRSAWLPWP